MKEPKQISFLIDLAKEGQEAKRVKEKVPILVILGNPPYSVSSENKSEFIEGLMNDYKEDVRGERNIQPLSDDYIKFIRFAHWKIEQSGKGILGFITNNSYLSGVIHRGMRKRLLETFDEIYILNLHGSSRVGEKLPAGIKKDVNVFAIQQGVAIALYMKTEEPQKEKKVYYADLWGSRSEKYDYLLTNDVETTRKQDRWQELKPVAPYYFFVPKDFALQTEYEKFWKVTEIFSKNKMGVITKRDKFIIDQNPQSLKSRILALSNAQLKDEEITISYGLRDTYEWKLHPAREKIIKEGFDEEKLIKYAYRPFDAQYIYFEDTLIARSVREIMSHLLKDNLAIVVPRNLQKGKYWNYVFVTPQVVDLHLLSILDAIYVFPLYLYSGEVTGQLFEKEASGQERTPNFTDKFWQAVKESLGTKPTPEEIFYYIYAVLYSPTYRQRYEEFLKIDFPRIPIPADYENFKALSNLGKELAELHLLKHPALQETEVGFPKDGSYRVDNVRYKEGEQRVYINKDQYFEGISKEVWEYRIGAYQVMEKYLKDRKGRGLSLDEVNHYMRVAKAIRWTIGLQGKVDEAYLRIG
jgi:predicted helicase